VIALPATWALLLLAGAWSARPIGTRITGDRRRLDLHRFAPAGAAACALVGPVPVLVAMIVVLRLAPVLVARRARRLRSLEVVRTLPELVDLFHLAVGAGLTVPVAVRAVAGRAGGPIADELVAALGEVELGRRLGDALADVPARTGDAVRPLLDALVASDRYGAPLGDALGRLAAEVRADRRRRAEEAARKVPVKLLFPLVCCVLPAFGLLTLAPLIAGAVAALRL
jgi:tight adherence protein C